MKEQEVVTNQILNDNIWQLMVKFSVPGILGMLLIGLNTFVDALYVGQLLGEDALAGISLAFPLTYIITGVSSMLGVGSASVLSRAIGAGDMETQKKIFGNLTMMSLLFAVVLTALGFFFSQELIAFMGGSERVLNIGTDYFKMLMLGSVFNVFAISTSMIIRAEGKIKQAMVYTGASMIFNMILNPIFIVTLGLGVKGAALATVLSTMIYAVLNFRFFTSEKSSIPVDKTHYALAPELIPQILAIGSATFMMQLMTLIQQVLIFKSLSIYGTHSDIAFMGATTRIFMLTVIPVFGMMQALQPIIGINYGFGNIERVKQAAKVFLISGTTFVVLLWLPMQIFSENTLSLLLPDVTFTPNDIKNFRIVMLVMPGLPLIMVGVTMYQAIGNAKMAGILTIMRQIVLFIPAIIFVPTFLGVDGIYLSMTGVDIIIVAAVAIFMLFEFDKFGQKQVQPNAELEPLEEVAEG
ncbi:multi antimicrobial extrusion protein MatE [Chloroherpeton thalassium ATCC 35110]|uniref:Multidrug export protein MepA n=1 Tax=Chloroherpeton thalassium (strain ATCC 35110 / GB-78) TaxID=517418 RepID=B3QSK2_CHLT3|nr:MATE family efflux transporter [Chloroherpeton thalassium]ACF14049.1 multi antimicrobial extrusion protein MatE [Chloroherpeton thalassium ATCC 35110]